MIDKSFAARCAAGVIGGLLLVNIGAAAYADVTEHGTGNVDVKVDIAPTENGALSLTIAGTETALSEQAGTATYREFTGALPNVTVTDTREDVAPGVFWSVTGQAGDFVGSSGQDSITALHLGWAPALVGDSSGKVTEGDVVEPQLEVAPAREDGGDPPTGLETAELLAMALDSADAQATAGQWTVGAQLKLKTPVTVAPGSYTSVLTLSLFEDSYPEQ